MTATKRQSIGPFRVTPTSDMQELTRSLNQQLALITTHLNDRMGFSGPVKLHDHADLQGNHLQNYPDAPPTGSAASVAQLQAIQALIDDLQRQANAIQARLLQVAGLTTTAPTQIDAADVAAVGTSPLAAHGDHGHAVNTAAVGDLAAVSTAASAGVSLKIPRSDHVHTIANNTVTDAVLRDSAAVSVVGRSANSSGDPADIAAGANGNVLRRAANVVGFGQIDVSDGTNAVTGALPIANGGSGQTTATAAFNALDPLTTKGDVIVHDGTNSVRVAVGTNGQLLVADSGTTPGIAWKGTVQTYAITNVTTDRAYDADLTTIDEIADCLGTLVADLRSFGVLL